MKKILVILAVVAMVSIANITFAGGNESVSTLENTVEQNQTEIQKQAQIQGITYAPQSNGNKSLGSLPFTGTHYIGAAEFPLNDYGHFISQFSLKTSVQFMRVLTSSEVQTIKDINDGMNGAEKWERRNRKIIPSPIIKRTYQAARDSKGYFVNPKVFVEQILPRLSDEHIMGIMLYNSKLDKENPVNVPHFQVRVFEDLAPLGANVFVPVDQFFQGYFVPEGFEFSVSGIFSWISKSFLNGGAVSPSAGVSKQQNTEFGRPGAAFVVCSVPLEILFPPKSITPPAVEKSKEPEKLKCNLDEIWARIRMHLEACLHCKTPCLNNEIHRKAAGDGFLDLYECTGDKKYLAMAIEQYQIAERDFFNGKEPDGTPTKKLAGAQETVLKVYYNWSWAIRELNGKEAQYSFARAKELKSVPTCYTDLKR
ncbi:MAG: hypothetical protein WC906_00980 [Parcubacteria group bacterium]|jgi:hypothetical protein